MQEHVNSILTNREILRYSAEMLTTLSHMVKPLHNPILASLLNLAAIEAERAASAREGESRPRRTG
jgi:hypothetical protein